MAALILFTMATSAAAAEGEAPEFSDGHRDRAAWEDWFSSLSGDARSGAEAWALQRSLAHPIPCGQPDKSEDWRQGCYAALNRLAAPDVRRHVEPSYRAGWNAPLSPVQQPPPAEASMVFPPSLEEKLLAGHPPSENAESHSATMPSHPANTHKEYTYSVNHDFAYGCATPGNSVAIYRMLMGASVDLMVLQAEANANDCYSVSKSVHMKKITEDVDTHSLLMDLGQAFYVLGRDKITQLWFVPQLLVAD